MSFRSSILGVIALTSLLASGCATKAAIPAPAPASGFSAGLLVVAHGAGAEWNAAVRSTVAEVTWNGPVEVAFLMGPEATVSGWDSAVTRLERAGARSLVVVPLMVSTYGSHYRQIQHYAGQLESLPPELASHAHHGRRPSVPVRITPALDGSPEMVAVVALQWSALGETERGRTVVLVGHGPSDDGDAAQWTAQLGRVGAGLKAAGLRNDVRSGLLRDDADAPVRAAAIASLRDTVSALAARSQDSVLAVVVVIARSALTRTTIPRDLAGLPVRPVALPLAPSSLIARWIERVARVELRVARE